MARRMVLLFCALVQVAALASAAPVQAHDHEVPSAELHHRDLFAQPATVHVYCWGRLVPPSGRYCDDVSYHYPDPYRFAEPGQKELSIRFNTANPPHKVWLRGWQWVDRYPQIDETYGRGTRFPVQLRPTVGPTGLSWYADFTVPKSEHWYLRAFVKWRDVEGRLNPSQHVIYYFHTKMRVPDVWGPPAEPQ